MSGWRPWPPGTGGLVSGAFGERCGNQLRHAQMGCQPRSPAAGLARRVRHAFGVGDRRRARPAPARAPRGPTPGTRVRGGGGVGRPRPGIAPSVGPPSEPRLLLPRVRNRGPGGRGRKGAALGRRAILPDNEVWIMPNGLRVTAPGRTVVDCARHLDRPCEPRRRRCRPIAVAAGPRSAAGGGGAEPVRARASDSGVGGAAGPAGAGEPAGIAGPRDRCPGRPPGAPVPGVGDDARRRAPR